MLGKSSIDVDDYALNLNGTGDLGNAIGRMDISLHADKTEYGWRVSIFGGDVYDFHMHRYEGNIPLEIANNLALKEQIDGHMIPYPWFVRMEYNIE